MIEQTDSDTKVTQSHERARLAIEAARIGLWSWQPDEDLVVWENEYPHRILGVAPS